MVTHIQRRVRTYQVDHRVDLTLYTFGAHAHVYTFANKRLNACVLHAEASAAHMFVHMRRPYNEHPRSSCTTLSGKYAFVKLMFGVVIASLATCFFMHCLPICMHVVLTVDCHQSLYCDTWPE